jgi:hypothetical protein
VDWGIVNQHRLYRLATLTLVIGLMITGCIRPEESTPTPDNVNVALQTPAEGVFIPTSAPATTPAPAPTNPATLDPGTGTTNQNVQLANAINQYFLTSTGLSLPVTLESLDFWNGANIEPDVIVGFIFNNPSNLPCVGVAAYNTDASGVPNVFSGGYHCSTDLSAPGIAGQWLIGLSDGRALVAITGWVTTPNVPSVDLLFENGTTRTETLQNGKFLLLRTDLSFAQVVNVSTQEGNLVGQLAVPLNPAG